MRDDLQSDATPPGERDNPANPSTERMGGGGISQVAIDAMRRLADAASPGPWRNGHWSGQCHLDHLHARGDCKYDYEFLTASPDDDYFGRFVSGIKPITIIGSNDYGPVLNRHDAAFIAAARTAVPALCDEVERLRSELADTEQALVIAITAFGDK